MEIKKIREQNFDIVIEFLNNNFSSPTHWPEWNLVVSKYFNTTFFYFGAYEKADLIGICPIHEEKKGLFKYYNSGQFRYIPFGGWIFSKPSSVVFKDLHIEKLSYLQLYSLPLLNDFKFSTDNKGKTFKTLVINLEEEINNIWDHQLSPNKRNKIRKAKKNSVVVEVTKNFDDCFYKSYENAASRAKLLILPKGFFQDLLSNSININFKILTASLHGASLARRIVAYDKNYSFTWLSWLDNVTDCSNFGQGELLQWEAIKWMKGEHCRYYDLCYIDKERLPKIHKFKSGFSKNEVDIQYVVIKPLTFKIINKIKQSLNCFNNILNSS